MHQSAAPRRLAAAAAAAVLAGALFAGTALAHAQLVSSDPADGSAVPFPSTITLTFDDDLDAAKSQFQVVDASGGVVATGHVTAADAKTMQATGLSLAWGPCQVRWTAVASDGDLTRGTISFTVIQPGAVSVAPSVSAHGPSTAPAASADAGSTTGSGADAILPIVVGLVLVGVVGLFVLRRSRGA